MTRVKTGTTRRRRHKKTLVRAKGFRMTRSRLYKVAHETALKADAHAYVGRKLRKRDMRRLWIQRINAALTPLNKKYSRFIHALKENKIELNRKMLADIAVKDPDTFKEIVKKTA